MSSSPVLHSFRGLGTIDLTGPGGERVDGLLRQPKRLALFAYLASQPEGRTVARESLVGLFWPESTDSRARNALAQALHVIRREMGSDVVVSSGSEQLALPESAVRCDVRAFRADVEAGRWKEALDRYGGDYLPGFHVPRADDFTRWLEEERRDLRRLALEASREAAAAAELDDDLTGALAFVRRGMALAPFEERGLRHLMAILLVVGDRAKAAAEYELFRERLQAEMGMEPSETSSSAYRALLDGADASGLETPAGRPALARSVGSVQGKATPQALIPEGEAVAPAQVVLASSREVASPRVGRDERTVRQAGKAVRFAIALGVVGLLVGTAMTAGSTDADPPVKVGSVAVTALRAEGEDEASRRAERLSTKLRSTLSASTFAELVVTPRASARDQAELSRGHRALGIEHTIVLDPSTAELAFSVLDNEAGEAVAVGSLLPSLSDSAALDRVLGAATLHLDRSVGDWGGLSSVQPSYQAARAFIESMHAWRDLRNRDSFESLQSAARAEPWFPLVLLELVEAYGDLGERAAADSLLLELRSRKSELSRYESLQLNLLEARKARDKPRMLELARRLGEMVPERFLSHGAAYALDLGKYDLAMELGDRVDSRRALMPNADFPRIGARHGLGLHEQEYALADSLRRLTPETIWLNNATVQALAALGHTDGVEELLREIETRPKGWTERGYLRIRQLAVKELMSHGHDRAAQRVLGRGLTLLAESADSTLRETDLAAWFYRQGGELEKAERINRARVEAFPEWVGSIVPLSELALIRLERGDVDGALRYADRVGQWAGHETAGDRAKAREASIYAAAGQEDRAVTLVREALRMGLSHVTLRTAGWELRVLRGHPEFDALFPRPTF